MFWPAVLFTTNTTDNGRAIQFGTNAISDPEETDSGSNKKHYIPNSYVYFGENGTPDKPIKWRVLDADKANDSQTDGMFLLSECFMDRNVKFLQSASQKVKWEGSDAQKWCNDFAANSNNFSSTERSAMLGVAKTETAGKWCNKSWGANSLTEDDMIFFLSAAELASYVGNYAGAPGWYAESEEGSASIWWLRSPDSTGYNYAGAINFTGGSIFFNSVSLPEAARPAFNLDLDSVLFTSAAVGGKDGTGLMAVDNYSDSEWKLTLLDEDRNFAVTETTTAGQSGGTITLNYSGATVYKETTDPNEYISAIIADNSGALYYGRLLQPTSENGTVSLEIPDTLADGTYTLHVFSEQYNGGTDDDTKLTDYASAFNTVTLTVGADTTVPVLTAGTVTRSSENEAMVKFTSGEAGSYYYAVVESSAAAPTIDTTGAGASCDTTEQTIVLESLSGTSAKDIYIVVKDAAGNVSANTFNITIPAYVPSVPPTITTTDLPDGTVGAAYSQTLTATGDTSITWSVKTGTNLPAGLNLNSTNGLISGTPTTEGTSTFTIVASNGISPDAEKEFSITVNAAPTYIISANPTALNFGSATVGYTTAPTPQTVTITNMGNQSLTLTQPTAMNYTIGTLSKATLAAGDIATCTVQPKPDLGVGTYNEKITVQDEDSSHNTASIEIAADYTVTSGGDRPSGGSSSGGSDSNTVTTPPTPTAPDSPTTGQTPTAKSDGNGNVSIQDSAVDHAISEAKQNARKNSNLVNGIAVTVPVETTQDQQALNVTLKEETLDTLVTDGVKRFAITTDDMISVSLNEQTLRALDNQTTGDIILRVKRTAISAQNPYKAAVAAIGTRPVYDISLWYVKDSTEVRITSLNGNTISIAVPYTPASDESTGNLYAVYVDGNGNVEWLTKSSYNADRKAVIFEASHFSIYGVGYKNPAPVFTDITNHWAKADIEFAASRGLLDRTGNGLFSPNTGMTRGMFVTALGRLAGVDPNGYNTGSFSDVEEGGYYAPYVNWAVQNGIIGGTSTTTFSPDINITREQMAVIMANYAAKLGYTLPKTLKAVTFTDSAQITTQAKDTVKAMQQAGILAGKDGNRFDPKGTATRAEVAAVLRRFVEIVIDPQTANGWTQNDSGQWYYFYADGSMAVNTAIDGYTIGKDGVCQ